MPYFRQDSAAEMSNRASYMGKPVGIPDFAFSFHNFEDLLVLHMDDDAIHADVDTPADLRGSRP